METNWLDTQAYPFQAHYFSINGTQLHYIDEGQGDVILLVHGTPSWSFDFRYQIQHLSKFYRCIALDHIGFGLSDKPEKYDYSTQNHAKMLAQLIEYLGLKQIILVVHDFGGLIGFDYALKFPDNIQKIVVLNSWLWDASNEPSYQKMKKILKSPLLPFLYKYLNFSPRFLLPLSFFDKSKLTKGVHKQYTSPFSKPSERMGTLAFAKSLLNDQLWFESLWQKRQVLENKPFLFIWGMKDSFILPQYLDKFASAFPEKTIVKLENCGHFPQEEEKESVLAAIQAFI